jgi:hypothetical protein
MNALRSRQSFEWVVKGEFRGSAAARLVDFR